MRTVTAPGGPVFLLKIVRPDGTDVILPAGGKIEADLIELCVAHIRERGIGLGRTEAHVLEDIRAGMTAALLALKRETVKV